MKRLREWIIRRLGGVPGTDYDQLLQDMDGARFKLRAMEELANIGAGRAQRIKVVKVLDKDDDFPAMTDIMMSELFRYIKENTNLIKVIRHSSLTYVSYEAKLWVYVGEGENIGGHHAAEAGAAETGAGDQQERAVDPGRIQ